MILDELRPFENILKIKYKTEVPYVTSCPSVVTITQIKQRVS